MICPNCGCEQRDTERCIQCQMTLPGVNVKENAESDADSSPVLSVKRKKRESAEEAEEVPSLSERSERSEKTDRKLNRKGPIRVVKPERRPQLEEGAHKVLITTTQKIEGRKIKTYFGLINANIIIELDDQIESVPDKNVYSSNVSSRSQLKTGVLLALRDLRGEAALFGANAVVGASFNFHRVDPRSLLLSAVGTAVLVENLD